MASLSIARRRRAWLEGVISGATAQGRCELKVPKLKEIYEKGVIFGRANAQTPSVKAAVAAKFVAHKPKVAPLPMNRFGNRSAGGPERRRFDRPERRGF